MSLSSLGFLIFFSSGIAIFCLEVFLVEQMKGELPDVHRELGSPHSAFPMGWRGIASRWADFMFGREYKEKLADRPYLVRTANIIFWLYVLCGIALLLVFFNMLNR